MVRPMYFKQISSSSAARLESDSTSTLCSDGTKFFYLESARDSVMRSWWGLHHLSLSYICFKGRISAAKWLFYRCEYFMDYLSRQRSMSFYALLLRSNASHHVYYGYKQKGSMKGNGLHSLSEIILYPFQCSKHLVVCLYLYLSSIFLATCFWCSVGVQPTSLTME